MNFTDLIEKLPLDIEKIPERLPDKTALKNAKRIIDKLPSIKEGFKYLKMEDKNQPISIGYFLERNATVYPFETAIHFENLSYNHREFNEWANRYANFFISQGVEKGDVVSVFLENRPQVLFCVAGLAKIGAISALINNKQRKKVLTHSFTLCKPKKYIIGEELVPAFEDIKADLKAKKSDIFFLKDDGKYKCPASYTSLDPKLEKSSTQNPDTTSKVFLKDPCFYIYTSGTTGLPKAAIMTHFRWVKAGSAFGMIAMDLKQTDTIYVSLPFYHNNALTVAWGSAACRGAAIAIKRRFSASQFWDDCRKYKATAFCYIGELCRYLYNQPRKLDDGFNPVNKIIGNGLRPDIWKEFKERFDIEEVYEFYAASEGNIAFVNLLNLDCTVGLCPAPYKIIKYDVENDKPIKDENGFLIPIEKGGTGLLIGEVSKKYAFDGYTDKSANDKKLLKDVFKKGDVWFNSGDLLKDMGFRHAQFVDRIGDTFRWKSENVSTNEVAEVVNGFNQINESTVYGVQIPGTEGRACMASIVTTVPAKDFNFDALGSFLRDQLPAYALPVFLRVQTELEITGTFKQKKGDLKKEGFNPKQVKDPLYINLPRTYDYVPLSDKIFKKLENQEYNF